MAAASSVQARERKMHRRWKGCQGEAMQLYRVEGGLDVSLGREERGRSGAWPSLWGG